MWLKKFPCSKFSFGELLNFNTKALHQIVCVGLIKDVQCTVEQAVTNEMSMAYMQPIYKPKFSGFSVVYFANIGGKYKC